MSVLCSPDLLNKWDIPSVSAGPNRSPRSGFQENGSRKDIFDRSEVQRQSTGTRAQVRNAKL